MLMERAKNQESRMFMDGFYLDSCLLLLDSNEVLFHQMAQCVDHAMELM